MKLRTLTPILLLTILSSQSLLAQGSTGSGLQKTAGYYKTKMLCGGELKDRYLALGSLWAGSFSDAGIMSAMYDATKTGDFRQLQPGSEFKDLINDPQHFDAIEECFGQDMRQRNLFFIGLMAADISAKFTAWALDITMLRGLYLGARAVLAGGKVDMPQRYMWFRVVFRLAIKNRSLMQKLSQPIFVTTLFSSLAAQGISNALVNEQIILDEQEQKDPTLMMLLKELDEYKTIFATGNSQEREVLSFTMDRVQASIDQQRADLRARRSK